MRNKCILILLLVLIAPIRAYPLSLNIEPSNIKAAIKPGDSVSGNIIIQNLGSSKIKIKAYTEDWIYAQDGSKNFMKAGSSTLSCSNWIKLDPATFELGPKEVRKVSYTITPPKTSSGSHVSVIFFEGVIGVKEGIAVAGRIGSIVYLDTDGDIIRSGEIKSFSASPTAEGCPAILTLAFQNKGNSFISAKPKITVIDGDNKTTYGGFRAVNSLPGDTVTSTFKLSSPLKEGRYKAAIELTFDEKTLKAESDFNIIRSSDK